MSLLAYLTSLIARRSNPREKKVLTAFLKNNRYDFQGGIYPLPNKEQSLKNSSRQLALGDYYYVPTVQHNGKSGVIIVKEGDYVLKGDPLTRDIDYRNPPVHSPTSGKIIAIGPHLAPNQAARSPLTIVIKADGKDAERVKNPRLNYQELSPSQLLEIIHNAGIAGLGGGVFPSAQKIASIRDCQLIILNGAECEPYISCDDMLMQESADEILTGGQILAKICNAEHIAIAIEDNKPKAIASMQRALNNLGDPRFHLRVIASKYPSGSSHQLIEILTGIQLPHGTHSGDIGILMQNVATSFAIKRAVIDDEPLTTRLVTLTGNRIKKANNYWVRLGTPIEQVLDQCGYEESECLPLIIGGPLMGFSIINTKVPVAKNVNCILAPDERETTAQLQEQHCIRCGKCSEVCPVGLLPQELYWQARAKNNQKATALNLHGCIECGACAFVCPSNIPLVQYFQNHKQEIADEQEKQRKASIFKERYEARNNRLAEEKLAREQRIKAVAQRRREQLHNEVGEDPVKAALARIQAKKQARNSDPVKSEPPSNATIIAARKAARKAARLAKKLSLEQKSQNVTENTKEKEPTINTENNNITESKTTTRSEHQAVVKNEKIADAARADESQHVSTTSGDQSKQAIAAAIARAKAKKQQISHKQTTDKQ